MCTLIVYYGVLDDYPIVIAANRDEQYNRPTRSPYLLCQQPRVYAGRDEQAGGTWLGANEFSMVAAILNRHTPLPVNPTYRSRGLLCLDLLRRQNAMAAKDCLLADARRHLYNSFYLFWADPQQAYVAYNEADIACRQLAPGRYLLTNSSVIDLSQHMPVELDGLLSTPEPASLDRLFSQLGSVCQLHREIARVVDPPNEDRGNRAICVHASAAYGTVSSSLLAIGAPGHRSRYLHADGPPCCTPYRELTGLFTAD